MINFKEEKSPASSSAEEKNHGYLTMIRSGAESGARGCCSKRNLYRKLPFLKWMPEYDSQKGISDAIAGITVGLTVIPQGIAYANVASLPPQYGLYSAFMGCFAYVFLGSSKDITVGPTAIMALMTAQYAKLGPDYAVLLTFLSGIITLVLGFLELGVVIDFISMPVIAGFTSAAAITIACTQIKGLLGLDIPSESKSHIEGVIGSFVDIFNHISTLRWQDTTLGICCVILLLSMRTLKNINLFSDDSGISDRYSTAKRIARKSIWLLSTARNAFIVILSAMLAFGLDPHPDPNDKRNSTFILTENITPGLPPFGPPPFSTNSTSPGGGMIKDLGSAIIIIPFVAILENIAIAKAFADGNPVDASQEMIALGACNLLGSFVRSMPTTGSFSRTAVNSSSGVKTPLGGIYTGLLVILSLAFLMPACQFIPKATLSAVIITAVIFSVEYEVIRPMWKSKRIDLIPAIVTFIFCLFWALEFGILIGVFCSIFIILYHTARPQINIEMRKLVNIEYIYISPDRAITFPAASYIRTLINEEALKDDRVLPVVLDCQHICSTDFTSAKMLKAMVTDFKKRKQIIIFYGASPSVEKTLSGVKIDEFISIKNEDQLSNFLQDLYNSELLNEERNDEDNPPNSPLNLA